MNLSPVFGLFPDEDGTVQERLDAAVGRALPLEAADHLGVISRLWPVTDQAVVSAVTGLMGPKPVFIADGHHRYETSLKYLEERRQLGEVRDADAAANFVLMMLVSMNDPGLLILPTHRLASGLPGLKAGDVEQLLRGHFQLTRSAPESQRAAWERLRPMAASTARIRDRYRRCVANGSFSRTEAMNALAPEQPCMARAGVAVLHQLVFQRLVRMATGVEPSCRFVHLLVKSSTQLRRKTVSWPCSCRPLE